MPVSTVCNRNLRDLHKTPASMIGHITAHVLRTYSTCKLDVITGSESVIFSLIKCTKMREFQR